MSIDAKSLNKVLLNQIKQYVKRMGVVDLHGINLAKLELHFPEFLSYHNFKLALP